MRRRLALVLLAASLATTVMGINSADKASAAEGCWWYTNEMGRNSNCDGLWVWQKPECDVWSMPYTADVVGNGGVVATAYLWYHGGPCRTVEASLHVHDAALADDCYVKAARTQSGGGEKAVYGQQLYPWEPTIHQSPMLYNSGRKAYAWAHCTLPGGGTATAKTPILYTPPA